MELPADVLLHNALLGLKGSKATLISISPQGFYEVKITFGGNVHRVLLPVAETVVIFRQPEPEVTLATEIER
ncbi:MAG: hypothetical protein D6696_01615 [Acidobacteria bacterium]|nr:MAG: hypothetical protein D6696_01615 [Acidobacteriota bacterium]